MIATVLYAAAAAVAAVLFARSVYAAWRRGHEVAQERNDEWLARRRPRPQVPLRRRPYVSRVYESQCVGQPN